MNTDFYFGFGRDAFHRVPNFLPRRFGTRVERVPTSANSWVLGVTLDG
jgi:hypothetical protein